MGTNSGGQKPGRGTVDRYGVKGVKRINFGRSKTAGWLLAVGEPSRLKLIKILTEGPKSVTELATKSGLEVASVSHHLGTLLVGGVLDCVADGRKRIYSLKEGTTATATDVFLKGPGCALQIDIASMD